MSQIFTNNSKTILSLDFSRSTCSQQCAYCYVKHIEQCRPAYAKKIVRNTELAIIDPEKFAENLNNEYKKLENSRSKTYKNIKKLPVRMYGAGDYVSQHYDIFKNLDFKFFIISKSIVDNEDEINKLLALQNLTGLVLSFDLSNLHKIKAYNHKKIKYAFTGSADDFDQIKTNFKFTIFFNTSKRKTEIVKARKHREQCPCDTKLIAHNEACAKCSKCWR